MNREIKFRAYSEQLKCFVYGYYHEVEVEGVGYSYIFWQGNTIPVRADSVGQFTGLLDKNGKEIYEGDVIKHDLGHERFKKLKWQVVFEFGSFQLRTESEHNPVSFPYHAHQAIINNSILSQSEYCEHIEIIGNIYENPNLIN